MKDKEDQKLSPEGSTVASETSGNGKHEKEADELKHTLNSASIENAFRQTSRPSALDYLVSPGDNLHAMLMRVMVPNKRPESMRFVIAAMHYLAQCDEFDDEVGKTELENIIAFMVSMDGTGRQQLVDAIIGESKYQGEGGGFGNFVKKLAFGNKKGNSQNEF